MIKYSLWIEENVKDPYGACKETTEEMQKVFPELDRIRGHYNCILRRGKRMHWWLITKEGEIIDPTVAQFPSRAYGEYIPWKEGSPEPIGRCRNCGKYTYINIDWCSEKCKNEIIL